MAEGRSNHAIADRLYVSPKTVETHVGNLFAKLGLLPAAEDHRRVLAVLTYLRPVSAGQRQRGRRPRTASAEAALRLRRRMSTVRDVARVSARARLAGGPGPQLESAPASVGGHSCGCRAGDRDHPVAKDGRPGSGLSCAGGGPDVELFGMVAPGK